MKILVTGGAGFLGSHIVDALESRGHDVSVFDVIPSKYASAKTKTIIGDITDRNAVDGAVKGHDVVYHFSGISGIEDCKKNPRKAFDVNAGGTLNVLEACVHHAVARIVFASSAYVFSKYGYVYKTTKIACENMIRDFSQMYGIKYTNIRYGSLYGRRADERNSIYNLLRSALIDGKVVYKGSGDEMREYIHVCDAANISADILSHEYENKDIIITGNEKFKYKDILKIIQEIIDKDVFVDIKEREDCCHYTLTPYTFTQHIGIKVTRNEFIDFGQGLLDCLEEISMSQGGGN